MVWLALPSRRALQRVSDDGRFQKYTRCLRDGPELNPLTTHNVRPALFLGRRYKPPCVGLVWPLWSHSTFVLPPRPPTPLRYARLADSTQLTQR